MSVDNPKRMLNRGVLGWTISLAVAWGIVLAGGFFLVRRALMPAPEVGGDPRIAYAKGRSQAELDVGNGIMVVKEYGYPVRWINVYRSNLWNRYHIELRPVAGCDVTDLLIESVRGYNEVSTAEIERRHGVGVLDRSAREAALEWESGRTNR